MSEPEGVCGKFGRGFALFGKEQLLFGKEQLLYNNLTQHKKYYKFHII